MEVVGPVVEYNLKNRCECISEIVQDICTQDSCRRVGNKASQDDVVNEK